MTKRNQKHVSKPNTQPTGVALLHACGIGIALGMLLLLVMAVILSFAVQKSETPSTVIRPAAMICLFACGYGGALAGAKKSNTADHTPYIGGLAVFGALAAIVLLVSLFVKNESGVTVWQRLLPMGVLCIACALGSLTAAWHRPSQKKQLKKLMRR